MIAVLSELISTNFEKASGIKALPLKPYSKLDLPVSSHADMLLCVIDKNVFCYKDYYNENIDLFKRACTNISSNNSGTSKTSVKFSRVIMASFWAFLPILNVL